MEFIISRVLMEETQEESDGRCRDESSERMQRRSEDATGLTVKQQQHMRRGLQLAPALKESNSPLALPEEPVLPTP